MKALFRKLLFLSSLACLPVACDEDKADLSDVVVTVSPVQSTEVILNAGEKALYKISVSTVHDFVSTLKITSFDPQYGLQTLEQRDIDKKRETDILFTYTAPEIDSENATVTLTFEAEDNLDNHVSVARTVTVLKRALSIAEQTGIVLFNPSSGLPDALSLDDVSRPFNLADAPDKDVADIYINPETGFDNIIWMSNTKTKFVRYNNFNYSTASATDIMSVFRSSVPTDKVEDIKVNDIILVGHGDRAQGVFRVVNVLMGQGSASCIQLSYKGVFYTQSEDPEDPAPDKEDPDVGK